MSDFNPGPGWREIEGGGLPQKGEAYLHWAAGPEGPFRDWVREAPVPALPIAPYTVIRVNWKDGSRPQAYALIDSRWGAMTAEELAPQLDSFEVLSEPRAITAKAVLGRLLNRLDAEGIKVPNIGEWIDMVGREFGVES